MAAFISALPGGNRNTNGNFNNIGNNGNWLSSTEASSTYAWYRFMFNDSGNVYRFNSNMAIGFSVRCVKGEAVQVNLPTLSTIAVTDLTANTATSGGSITDDGGSAVTARGVVWSTTENPTLGTNEEGSTNDGGGTGSFESQLTNLTSSTTYYVRAYGTNSLGTAYGNQVEFTTQWGCGDDIIFTYRGATVTYGSVENTTTGKCWMDRNLGASGVATAYNDSEAYGDLFQWGRLDDGHQNRFSGTTSTRSSSDSPGHSSFITHTASPYDWRDPQNDNLWQGDGGINDVCPAGWRVPIETELNNERLSWSSNDYHGAYASPLKFVAGGSRNEDGSLRNVGSSGRYWSSSVSGSYTRALDFDNSSLAGMSSDYRVYGRSVRCIRDN